jgi:hypothetical protein
MARKINFKGIKILERIIMGIAIIFKSLFMAVTQVAWGLIALFGFNALIVYLYKTQGLNVLSVSRIFLQIEGFIQQRIMLFVWIFFIVYLYFEIRELIKVTQ